MLTFLLALTQTLALAAPTPAERIARGEAAMAALEYEVAADELTLAASDDAATEEERLHASLQAGIANVIISRSDMARLHFRYVLLRAPTTTLAEDAPQKVASFFALIRNELAAERASAASAAAAAPVREAAPGAAAPDPVVSSSVPAPAERALLPIAVAGLGTAVAVGGAALTGLAEATLGDPALPLEDRIGWLNAGRAGLFIASLGVVVAATGGVIAVVE